LLSKRINAYNNAYRIADYIDDFNKNFNDPLNFCSFIKNKLSLKVEWISYSQITNLEQIAEGGFGVIYKALNNGNTVAIKKLINSQSPSKHFLNEVIYYY